MSAKKVLGTMSGTQWAPSKRQLSCYCRSSCLPLSLLCPSLCLGLSPWLHSLVLLILQSLFPSVSHIHFVSVSVFPTLILASLCACVSLCTSLSLSLPPLGVCLLLSLPQAGTSHWLQGPGCPLTGRRGPSSCIPSADIWPKSLSVQLEQDWNFATEHS